MWFLAFLRHSAFTRLYHRAILLLTAPLWHSSACLPVLPIWKKHTPNSWCMSHSQRSSHTSSSTEILQRKGHSQAMEKCAFVHVTALYFSIFNWWFKQWQEQLLMQLTSINGNFPQAVIWHFRSTAFVTVESTVCWVKKGYSQIIYFSVTQLYFFLLSAYRCQALSFH